MVEFRGSSLDEISRHENASAYTDTDENNPFEHLNPSTFNRIRQTMAIGGGKGGVGKSLLASSLAISLARSGNKVIAIDLDLGGANLHTALGIEQPRMSLSDFFSERVKDLHDCLTPSGFTNLNIISGAQDSVSAANIRFHQKVKLMDKMRELDTDYLVLDLGAGTAINTLDFFLYSDMGLAVLLPEPTSIENVYRFIKSVYFRHLLLTRELRSVRPLIRMAMDSKNPLGIKTPSDLFREVNRNSPECGSHLKRTIQNLALQLIVNQARTQTDINIGFSVKSVCKKYFGLDMDFIGYLDYDSAVWQAVRRKRPFMTEFPNSQLVSSIDRMADHLLKRYHHSRSSYT